MESASFHVCHEQMHGLWEITIIKHGAICLSYQVPSGSWSPWEAFWSFHFLMSPPPSPPPPLWDHWYQTRLLIRVVGEYKTLSSMQPSSWPLRAAPVWCLSHFTCSLHDARQKIDMGGHVWTHRLDTCNKYRIVILISMVRRLLSRMEQCYSAWIWFIHCDTITNSQSQTPTCGTWLLSIESPGKHECLIKDRIMRNWIFYHCY